MNTQRRVSLEGDVGLTAPPAQLSSRHSSRLEDNESSGLRTGIVVTVTFREETGVIVGSVTFKNPTMPFTKHGAQPTLRGGAMMAHRQRRRRLNEYADWPTPKKPKRRPRMTVCIAAICALNGAPMIVGASDRMITYAEDSGSGPATDIEYEQQTPKVFQLDTSCVALISDDLALGMALAAKARSDVHATRRRMEVGRDPIMGIPFTEIGALAEVYATVIREHCEAKREWEILHPLFLDRVSWVAQQKELSPFIVRSVATALRECNSGVETIIAGVDLTGAHVYTVNADGHVACHDAHGFAAIGNGGWHAESEFMVARYSGDWRFDRAAFLVYGAKKRSERASGVGPATDMFVVLGAAYTPLNPVIVNAVQETWQDFEIAVDTARSTYYDQIGRVILGYLHDAENAPPGTAASPGEPSPSSERTEKT